MSDARWFEIDAAVDAAVRHFQGAIALFARLPTATDEIGRYGLEMGFMHAMQSGHTSLETTLLRLLDLFGEEAPTGARWHADLIARAARNVGDRPALIALLPAEIARFRQRIDP